MRWIDYGRRESSIIRLVHYTTQEYLKQTKEIWFPEAESAITTTCITYLSFAIFETGFCRTDISLRSDCGQIPFYDYAAHNWGHHALKECGIKSKDRQLSQNNAKVEASSQALIVKQYEMAIKLQSRFSEENDRITFGSILWSQRSCIYTS